MKKFLCLLLAICIAGSLSSACQRKAGCPATENAQVKTNRKGELSTKGGRSQLFPKDMRKRMGRG